MSDNKPTNNSNESHDDEDFGLPKGGLRPLGEKASPKDEAEPAPIVPVGAVTPAQENRIDPAPETDSDTNEATVTSSSRSTWTTLLFLCLVVGLAGVAYYLGWFDGSREVGNQQTVVNEQAPIVSEPEPEQAEEPIVVEKEPEKLNLTEITSKDASPRYFVVVASFIDDDLAKDYANKLMENGVKTFLIHPYGDVHFYRLAVEQHASVADALTVVEAMQDDFEENLWVLKY